MIRDKYKDDDILYWHEVKSVIKAIALSANSDAVLPTGFATVEDKAPSEEAIKSIDAYNVRIALHNGGVYSHTRYLLKRMESLNAGEGDNNDT